MKSARHNMSISPPPLDHQYLASSQPAKIGTFSAANRFYLIHIPTPWINNSLEVAPLPDEKFKDTSSPSQFYLSFPLIPIPCALCPNLMRLFGHGGDKSDHAREHAEREGHNRDLYEKCFPPPVPIFVPPLPTYSASSPQVPGLRAVRPLTPKSNQRQTFRFSPAVTARKETVLTSVRKRSPTEEILCSPPLKVPRIQQLLNVSLNDEIIPIDPFPTPRLPRRLEKLTESAKQRILDYKGDPIVCSGCGFTVHTRSGERLICHLHKHVPKSMSHYRCHNHESFFLDFDKHKRSAQKDGSICVFSDVSERKEKELIQSLHSLFPGPTAESSQPENARVYMDKLHAVQRKQTWASSRIRTRALYPQASSSALDSYEEQLNLRLRLSRESLCAVCRSWEGTDLEPHLLGHCAIQPYHCQECQCYFASISEHEELHSKSTICYSDHRSLYAGKLVEQLNRCFPLPQVVEDASSQAEEEEVVVPKEQDVSDEFSDASEESPSPTFQCTLWNGSGNRNRREGLRGTVSAADLEFYSQPLHELTNVSGSIRGSIPNFNRQLLHFGLVIRRITGDGNCVFRALSDQLNGNEEQHLELREDLVKFMSNHSEDYAPFVEDNQSFDEYLAITSKSGSYVGELAMAAFAKRHKVTIVIHKVDEELYEIPGGDRQLHIAFHVEGKHYSSVRKIGEKEDDAWSPANIHIPVSNLHSWNMIYLVFTCRVGRKSCEKPGIPWLREICLGRITEIFVSNK